jgi:general secretion pathway protein G
MIRRNTKAFTLIELLLVLVILAVLAAVVVPIYTGQIEKTRRRATIADISQLETSLGTFQVDNGRFPSTDEGLAALVRAPADLAGSWSGPYIKQITNDKWGHYYRYINPAPTDPSTYLLFSCGPDGQEYTADDITQYTTDTGVTEEGS